MIRKSISRRMAVALSALSIIALLCGYAFIAHRQHIANPGDTTIPTYGQLAGGTHKIIDANPRTGERWLLADSAATVSRLFMGLFFGITGSVIIGMLMGCFPAFESFFAPPLSLLAKIPPTAALAVFFVLAGTGTQMYVAMIAFGILPTLAQTIFLSVKEAPDELIYKASTLGASQPEIMLNVLGRMVLPKLIDTIRLQIGPAMVFLIAAEMVVGDVGFGYRIRLQSRLLNMDVVYPYLALLAAFGYVMDFSLSHLQKLLCPWHNGNGS